MDNKKIIFGILLFCAISFIAYTFADSLEKEDEGKLTVPGSNQTQNVGNNQNDDEDKDTDNDSDLDPNEPVRVDDETDDQNTNTTPVVVTPPSSSSSSNRVPTNSTGSGNNSGGSSSSGTNKPSTPTISVTDVVVNTSSNPTLVPGKTLNLGVSVLPSNATDKNVTYTSTNPNVATVDSNGNVTGVGPGTTTIIIVASNGVKKEITIKVLGNYNSTNVTLSGINNPTINFVDNGMTNKLTVLGSVTSDKHQFVVTVRIAVPSEYYKEELNVSYRILDNYLGISGNYQGNVYVKNIDNVRNGGAYIEQRLVLDEDILKDSAFEPLAIAVDWVGSSNPIIYYIDFSNVKVNG